MHFSKRSSCCRKQKSYKVPHQDQQKGISLSLEKVRPNSLSTLPHSLRQEHKKCSRWCGDYFSAEAQNSEWSSALLTVEGCPPHSDINSRFCCSAPLSGRYAELCCLRPKSVSCLENLSTAKTLYPGIDDTTGRIACYGSYLGIEAYNHHLRHLWQLVRSQSMQGGNDCKAKLCVEPNRRGLGLVVMDLWSIAWQTIVDDDILLVLFGFPTTEVYLSTFNISV